MPHLRRKPSLVLAAVGAAVFCLHAGRPAISRAADPTPAKQKSGSGKKDKPDKPAASPAGDDAPSTEAKPTPAATPPVPEAKPLTTTEMGDAVTLDTFTVVDWT